jgi:hypothetical protein
MRVGEISHFAEESIYGLGQGAAPSSFSGRIEVKDAGSGNFIAGATVTLLSGDKEPAVTVGVFNTDKGGNAAFMDVSPEAGTGGPNYWYRVEAPGYISQTIVAAPNTVRTVLLAKPAGKGVPIPAIVGGVVILGILGYAFFKK